MIPKIYMLWVKWIWLCAAFVWLSGPLFGQGTALKPSAQYDLVTGTVLNERGQGVPGWIEFLHPDTDVLFNKAALNDSGKFEILLPKNHRYYFVIRSGYFTFFFKDEEHIMETSHSPLPTTAEMGFSIWQYEPGTEIILHELNFEQNLYEVEETHKPSLDFLVKWLNANPSIHIQVGGHTDDKGVPLENQALSLDRADSVKEYLLAQGISDERISVYGYGDTRPIAPNTTEGGRIFNRRTSFIITQN